MPWGETAKSLLKSSRHDGVLGTCGSWLLAAALVVSLAMPAAARADDYIWIKATDNWAVDGNWDLAGWPDADDNAYINNGGTAQITAGSEACSWLYLGEAPGDSGTVELSGGELSSSNLRIGHGGAGTFDHTSGTHTFSGVSRIGNDAGSTGTYNLSGDGLLQSPGAWFVVGYHGTGTMNQSGGTVSCPDRLYVGEDTDSIGTYNLNGGTLETGREHIGTYSGGNGTFTHSGGTHTVYSDLYIGDSGGSQGSYTLSGTGELSTTDEYVGKFGSGTFTQTGGIHTIDDDLFIGSQAGSSGSFTLGGTGQLSVFDENVGRYGVGIFTQSGGTHTVTDDLRIGRYAGAIGTYSISGGSLNAAYLHVGLEGSGTFEITNAAAEVTVTEYLRFGTYSNFTAVTGATIHLANANLENRNADEAELADLADVNLVFEGGGEEYSELEVPSSKLSM